MALTQGTKINRRGNLPAGSYGYYVAPGEQVWRGSIVGLNANGQLQRVQTAGTVAIVGVCTQDYNNTANTGVSPQAVVVDRGTYQFPVTGATPSVLKQTVYATDDSTCTMSSQTGSLTNLAFGTLDGIDVALGPFVKAS